MMMMMMIMMMMVKYLYYNYRQFTFLKCLVDGVITDNEGVDINV